MHLRFALQGGLSVSVHVKMYIPLLAAVTAAGYIALCAQKHVDLPYCSRRDQCCRNYLR